MSALVDQLRSDELLSGNAHYAANQHSPHLRMWPARGLMIVGCVDPRVDPLTVLGLRTGDAAVIRNVGGRVTPSLLQTMAMLRQVGQPDDVQPGNSLHLVLLQHNDCGITRITSRDLLAKYFGVAESELDAKHLGDPAAAVAGDIAVLRANPFLPPDVQVSGLVFDVKTGLIDTIGSTARLRGEEPAR